MLSRYLSLLLVLCAVTAVVACGDDDAEETPEGTVITTTMKEFAIDASSNTASPGKVTFRTVNSGALPHELKLVKTDLAADKLPLDGAKVDEGDVDITDKTEQLASGESRDVTFDLDSGRYVLICNIEGHYQGGMHTGFSVQ